MWARVWKTLAAAEETLYVFVHLAIEEIIAVVREEEKLVPQERLQ